MHLNDSELVVLLRDSHRILVVAFGKFEYIRRCTIAGECSSAASRGG